MIAITSEYFHIYILQVRIILLNNNIVIKIKKLTLICYYYPILRPHSEITNCSKDFLVVSGFSLASCVIFSCAPPQSVKILCFSLTSPTVFKRTTLGLSDVSISPGLCMRIGGRMTWYLLPQWWYHPVHCLFKVVSSAVGMLCVCQGPMCYRFGLQFMTLLGGGTLCRKWGPVDWSSVTGGVALKRMLVLQVTSHLSPFLSAMRSAGPTCLLCFLCFSIMCFVSMRPE